MFSVSTDSEPASEGSPPITTTTINLCRAGIRLEDLIWHFPETRCVEILKQLEANGVTSWEAVRCAGPELVRQVTDREAAAVLATLAEAMESATELESFHPAGLLRLMNGSTSEYEAGARLCHHPIRVSLRGGIPGDAVPRRLKILHCSDTHEERVSNHSEEQYDIFIFSGDFAPQHVILKEGSPAAEESVRRFNAWLGRIPAKHKIVVAGNHDMVFETWGPARVAAMLTNAIYLCDSGVSVEGLYIWGSPWIAWGGGGFERHRAPAHPWRSVPTECDVLVTHSPPGGIMDIHPSTFDCAPSAPQRLCSVCLRKHTPNTHEGDAELRVEILARIRPVLHCFGHCHNSPGIGRKNGIVFSNAAYTTGLVFDLCLVSGR
jgi:predicted phosphohydrolase